MRGTVPKRPAGTSAQARWCQWVHDSIFSFLRVGQVRGAKVSSTTGGIFVEPLDLGSGSGGNSRVKQYLLTDASNGDYFVGRALSVSVDDSDPENPIIENKIGATDVFIAKPPHLRQSLFDRDVLNAEEPGNIGTTDEITYDVEVEAWEDPDLVTETVRWSYEYKSATFRIATNATDPDPDNWTTQNQTIIPRFVPAELVEPGEEAEDQTITTETITPTIIYAVRCSGLGVIGPEGVTISLLALSDAWAWSKTS